MIQRSSSHKRRGPGLRTEFIGRAQSARSACRPGRGRPVRPNPSLESGPSEAGRLGPGRVSRIIVAARAKAAYLYGPAQLER